MFFVRILGSGTSIPSPDRQPPAYLVHSGEVDVLLECGSGATTSLLRAGVGLKELTGIILSHFHLDHTSDLAALLFALANPEHPPRDRDLELVGPPGTVALLEGLEGLYGRWVRPRHGQVDVTELSGEAPTVQLGDLTWTSFPALHTAASLAFRIDGPGGSLCFSGDSGPCASLVEAATAVDLFICECAALEDTEHEGHMSASDVGEVARASGCRRVVLTHLYEHVIRTEPAARVREIFDGPVLVARDGMLLEVGR